MKLSDRWLHRTRLLSAMVLLLGVVAMVALGGSALAGSDEVTKAAEAHSVGRSGNVSPADSGACSQAPEMAGEVTAAPDPEDGADPNVTRAGSPAICEMPAEHP
jgi:hypothetical protein